MNGPTISLAQLQMFFMIFLRMSGIMVTMPLFDSRNVPPLFKLALAFSITAVVFPLLPRQEIAFVQYPVLFAVAIFSEILFGAVIGLTVRLLFSGIQLAGHITGVQMGLSMGGVLDPAGDPQIPVIAQFHYLLAMLLFLSFNAHHGVLRSVVDSFHRVPPGGFSLEPANGARLMALVGDLFEIAITIGAPVLAALLLVSVALGLVARTVPQMNIFVVAMPLKILIGLVLTAFSLPVVSSVLRELFEALSGNICMLMVP